MRSPVRLLRTFVLGAAALTAALVATHQPVRGLSSDLVISQVYGAGGNSGAVVRNDYVEIFNRGTVTVSLTGKSIQYTSASGTGLFSQQPITSLSGSLAPGQYYLVQLASSGTNGALLPPADVTGTANAAAAAGKFVLVNSTAGLACNGSSTVCSPTQLALIIDLVGWGSANFFETAAAPATSTTLAIFRKGGGCTETDNNAADFVTGAPAPRNTLSALAPCNAPTPPTGVGAATPAAVFAGDSSLLTVTVTPGTNPSSTGIAVTANLSDIGGSTTQQFFDDGTNGDVAANNNVFSFAATVAPETSTGAKPLPVSITDAQLRTGSTAITLTVIPPPMPIHEIQGAGLTSPYDGQTVTTRGVVTARRFNNAFFLQTPDVDADADPNTSEGIVVFTSSSPAVTVGSYVQVTGMAYEYIPGADPYSPPTTEIIAPSVTLLSGSASMPAPVTLTAADLPATGSIEQLERFEGMRIQVPFLRAVSPTDGSVSEPNATATSSGVFYAVIDGTPRPFREPGLQVPDPLPLGAPATMIRWDANPERLRINSWGQIGSVPLNVTAGALVSNTTGVLDFTYRTWTILPDFATPPVASGLISTTPVPVADANEFTIASYNLERFFDVDNDPETSDPVLTAAAFQKRLTKASLSIRTILRTPDIIGVQEVENLTTLQALATRINTDAVAALEPDPGYVAYLEEGNDPGGIDVGFLVKTSRVSVGIDGVVQEGKDATFVDPTDSSVDLLNDRPPLVLEAVVNGPSGVLPVTVIVNHIRSLNGIDDPVEGPRVRAKRQGQAEFLAGLVQTRQLADPKERIVLVGDFNAFEFNDGYQDVIGSVKGTPASAADVVLTGGDLVDPDLTDLADLVPAADRYSYSFEGSAQVLDHVIANGRAMQRFSRLHYARVNADFPEIYRGDETRPERLSDHDPAVAYFFFPDAPVLQLNGSNPQTVECCSAFSDPGATASDDDFGDLSLYITVSGAVDSNTVGSYLLTYSVSNDYTMTTVTRTVNVVDTTPAVLTLAGPNPMTVELGSTFVDPGAAATDTCAGDLTNFILISNGVNTSVVGSYAVTYTVSDGYNTTAVTRTVNVVDTTAPVVSAVTPTPDSLWPPNHKMASVGLGYSVTELSGSAVCSVGVLSNEPDNGTGDGDTSPDWLVSSPTALLLRAERSGSGSGRIYTITVTCRDASGNVGIGSTFVTVPKSKGK